MYIPLLTDDYKLAFCQTTNDLCPDVQRLIWTLVLDVEPTCPPAPRKPGPALRHLLKNNNHVQ
jgi:hypothetical protein